MIELILTDVAAGGASVARAPDGRVAFVRHGIPGERVVVRMTEEATSWLRGDVVEVLDRSADRVEAPCPYAGPGRCGGCDFQHVAVPAQRRLKGQLLASQLRRIGRYVLDTVPEVEDMSPPGAPDPAATVASPLLSESVEAVDSPRGGGGGGGGGERSAAPPDARGMAAPSLVNSGTSLEVGLGWRTRVRFGVDESGRLGLRRYRSHHLQLVDRCLLADPCVSAFDPARQRIGGAKEVELLSCGADKPIVIVDGTRVSGPARIVHHVLGRRFEVSAGSFWQVHPAGAEALGRAVLAALDPRPGEYVLDLYAGAGLFAGLLGDRVGRQGRVMAVEANSQSAADARRNLADQTQTEVLTGPVTPGLVERSLGAPDLVVLDPPRAGAGQAVIGALARLRPRRMAYVACDTATFSRDLRLLVDAGWSLGLLRAFDLFPMTEHVETLAVFVPPRRSAGRCSRPTPRAGRDQLR